MALAWWRFDNNGAMFQLVEEVEWVPTLGMGFRLGVDGIALAVAAMSALLFTAAIAYPVDTRGSARQYYAWLLFLEAASLGVFLTLDLLLFYVFFDLTLVGMYFLIAGWGHGKPERAALKFFIYTLFGSLFLLLAILGLYLAADPLTFDMRELIAQQPLAGAGVIASVVMAAFLLGFLIKTPLARFHTWLPAARCPRRRAGASFRHSGRRVVENGDLWPDPDPVQHDGRHLHPVGLASRYSGADFRYLWLAGVALLGLLISAALFLRILQSLFFGELPDRWKSMPDLNAIEVSVLGVLLGLVVLIGVYPAVLIDLVETSIVWLVGGQ
nr:proton-conducting transporter membrane subunit [Marinobacter adhaerens]